MESIIFFHKSIPRTDTNGLRWADLSTARRVPPLSSSKRTMITQTMEIISYEFTVSQYVLALVTEEHVNIISS